jgi:hypothetical protein
MLPINYNQETLVSSVIQEISFCRFSLENEKDLQEEIYKRIMAIWPNAVREHALDRKNIVDIFLDGIAIEIKIHASAMSIYRQCERYCEFESVKCLILATNRSMGFPKEINGKPCYLLKLGNAWL